MVKESVWITVMVSSFLLLLLYSATAAAAAIGDEEKVPAVVRRDERKQVMVTEYGKISSVDVITATRGPFHVEFITLNPNSLFLPVLLHSDMVFYVHTGSGKLSWGDGDEIKRVDLRRGDVYRLEAGSVFFLQSNLDALRQNLRVHAIFTTTDEDIWEPSIGAYSSISDLVLGFDNKLLQSAFSVSEEMIEEITSAPKPQGIVHVATPPQSEDKKKRSVFYELENRFLKVLATGEGGGSFDVKNKKKSQTFNVFESDPDFQNCNGWSLTVDKGNFKTLKGSHISVFMVNLTKGAMMGPHWNPMATEVGVVLEGEGMVRVVCSSNSTGRCKNKRFMVGPGDVFVVPRFHPMAQMSFNNASFVFMGFSTSAKKNHPQFLAGKRSVLRTLDKDVLALSFNASNTTIDHLLGAQGEAIILECVSCAEAELELMKKEIERERKEEEERKRKEEEEERKRKEEEERREEEEERRRKEEEEERERKEEEARREQEEARKEEEERKREEDEEMKRREEEERERKEEAAKREQEEARKEEEESRRKREEEEEMKRKEEEEMEKKEEAAAREQEKARQEEEERRKKREEEEEMKRKEEEEMEKKEERAETEQEEARKEEEERRRKREEEEEMKRKEEEEMEKKEERAETEQEEARKEEEERQRKREEEEKIEKKEEEERQRKREEEEEIEKKEEASREQEEAREAEEERQRKREAEGEEESRRREEAREAEEETRQKREEAAIREQEEARRQEERREREEPSEGGGGGEARGTFRSPWRLWM